MNTHKLKVFGVVCGVALVGWLIKNKLESDASASSSTTATSDPDLSDSADSLAPEVSASYPATDDTSYGDTAADTDTSDTSDDTSGASSTADFATLLENILNSGASYAAQSAQQQQSNDAQSASQIAAASPPPAAAPSSSATSLQGQSLFSIIGGYLTPNTSLQGNSIYEGAWNAVAQANENAAGVNWNKVTPGAPSAAANAGNQAQLTSELQQYINAGI